MKILKMLCLFTLFLGTTMYTTSCSDSCSATCENGGTCNDGTCDCAEGYEGESCADESRDKFVGNWAYSGQGSCSVAQNIASTVTEATGNLLQVNITNLTGYSEVLVANISGNTISIPEQTVDDIDGDSWTISSNTGTIVDNAFSLEVDYSGFATLDCTLDFVKQ